MRLELALILLLTSLTVVTVKSEIDWRNVKDDLGQGLSSTGDLVNGVRSGKVEDIVKSVTSMAALIPGPVGGVFSGVLAVVNMIFGGEKEPDPALVEISEKLSELAKEVRNVQNAVERAIHVIKVEVRGLRLKDVTAKLQVLQEIYEKFVNEKSPKAIADFLYSCGGIHEKRIFLYHFIVQDPYKYKPEVMAENNETAYVELVLTVERLLYQATILETACTSVQHRNATEKQRENMKQELIKSTQKYLKEIGRTSQGDQEYYMFDAATNIVEQFAPGRDGESNVDFGPKLFEKIKNSLPSSQFYLLVYGHMQTHGKLRHLFDPWKDDETIKIDTKPQPSFFHHWQRKWGRNIVLVRKGTAGPRNWYWSHQHDCSNRIPGRKQSCGGGWRICELFDCEVWVTQTKQCLKDRKQSYIAMGCMHGQFYEKSTFDLGLVTRNGKNAGENENHLQFVIF